MLLLTLQGPTLTLKFPPTRLPDALRLISEAGGVKLAAVEALTDEVVMARLKDAPIDVALTHLAESLCAKWTLRPDGIRWLEPDLDAERRMAQKKEHEDEIHILNSLKYVQKRLGEQPEELDQKAIDEYRTKKDAVEKRRKIAEEKHDYAHMFTDASVDEESPAWRALARIVLQMDPKILIAMANDAHEVWAENPTPMQHPFSDEAVQALKRYRQELSLEDPSQVAKRVKVRLLKWEVGAAVSAALESTDLTGKPLDSANLRLNDDSERMKIPFNERDPAPKPGETPLDIPLEDREARIALSVDYKGKDRLSVLDKWRPRLMDPVRYEPTQWHNGEDYVLAAEGADRNLIGTVSDFTMSMYADLKKLTPSQVLLKTPEDFLPSSDGWLVVRSHEQMQRASRSKAKALIADCVQLGGITVNAAADWASQSTDRWAFITWVGNHINVLFSAGGPYSTLVTTSDDTSLRLWASLGSGVIESLRAGATVQLSRLTEDAKEKIAKLVYWYGGLDEPMVDPTDRLPNGIIDGTLTMTVVETPVFYGWSSLTGPPATPMPIDAKQFGRFLAKGNTYWEIPAGEYRQYDHFRIGKNLAYIFHFILNPGAVPMTIKLSETLFDPNAQAVAELPGDLKAAAENARLAAIATPAKPPTKTVIPPLD